MSFVKKFAFIIALLSLYNCANLVDDLVPSSQDLRGSETNKHPGDAGNTIVDLSFKDSTGATRFLSDSLPAQKGVVLYFTMWCSTCINHTDYIINTIMPSYPNVQFYVVDYVTGTLSDCAASAAWTGIAGKIDVICDLDRKLSNYFGAFMSKTVVIDSVYLVTMNENFNTGATLQNKLNALP